MVNALGLLKAMFVVSPVTYEVLLVENGAIRAEESSAFSTLFTHVEGLAVSCCISVDARLILS